MTTYSITDIDTGTLAILAISSLAVYGIVCSGWASNSKYAFLGALRSTAQMISYEISIGLILLGVLLCVGSLNFVHITIFQKNGWFCVFLFPHFLLFYISVLAETNRAPFDLPESESELVAGYNTEYSAMGFALFFLGEYSNMMLMCSLVVIFFFGGFLPIPLGIFSTWIPPSFCFALKVALFLFGFIWIRAAYPRQRYDQLMSFGWKAILPLALSLFLINASFLFYYNGIFN